MSTPAEATGLKIAELQLYTIEEAMTMLRMGRTTIFDLLRNGRLGSVGRAAPAALPQGPSPSTSRSWNARKPRGAPHDRERKRAWPRQR